MVRPRRWRRIQRPPNHAYFSPQNNRGKEVVVLKVEEFEALRLKHYQKQKKILKDENGNDVEAEVSLTQQDAAAEMGISQPTFSRIIEEAHKKVTKALVHGLPIRIAGGKYGFKEINYKFGCQDCLDEWDVPENFEPKKPEVPPCIKCGKKRTFVIKREFLKQTE